VTRKSVNLRTIIESQQEKDRVISTRLDESSLEGKNSSFFPESARNSFA
jgi:hypothetical protein